MHKKEEILSSEIPINNHSALAYLEKSRILIRRKGKNNRIYSYISRIAGAVFTTGITLEGARQVGILQKIATNAGFSIPDQVGLLMMLGGSTLLALIVILRTGQFASSIFDHQFEKLRDRHLTGLRSIEATNDNLLKIRQAGSLATGDHTFVPLRTMEWLFGKNEDYIKAWVKNSNADENIGCFYIVAPITKMACKKMLDGRIAKNRDLTQSDVCKYFKNSFGLYVIEVFGADRMSKAAILYLLRSDMVKEILKSKGMRYVFTRPVNDFGLRQVTKLGFQPIGPHPYDMQYIDLYTENEIKSSEMSIN